ncbi:MAG: lamin tail domain-containing protein, partial [Methylococcales bacterium]|nr:lamin tail domain-containing protein [Methylococcales bacterium]
MKKIIIYLCILGIFLFLTSNSKIYAQSGPIINEFSSAVSNSDWVELYNNSDSFINLSDYSLSDGSTNTKNFSCILAPYGFLTVDWNNTLNNSGDIIYLKKSDGMVDCVSYGDGAGNKCEGKDTADLEKLVADESGARTVDGGSLWIKTTNITKDGPNDGSQKSPEAICLAPSSTPVPSPTWTITPTPTLYIQPTATPHLPSPTISLPPTPVKYENIYINEAMVNPAQNE